MEKIPYIDSSNRDNAASFVSANNAVTTPGCNDALELPNKDDFPPLNVTFASSSTPKVNESTEATAMVVAAKLSSRKADKGPP